jgi:hypothetical protein
VDQAVFDVAGEVGFAGGAAPVAVGVVDMAGDAVGGGEYQLGQAGEAVVNFRGPPGNVAAVICPASLYWTPFPRIAPTPSVRLTGRPNASNAVVNVIIGTGVD